VPAGVELGFHLCYSVTAGQKFGGDHLTAMVQVANALAARSERPLNWLHLPVPESADGDEGATLAPLAKLVPRAETELYLGLVHLADGVAGARRRLEAAADVVEHFGVATECGWGRTASARVPELLAFHSALAEPVTPIREPGPAFTWPEGFHRILDEDWTSQPLEGSGLAYDSVSSHGWYSNLDPTVEDLARALRDGDILLDYSGGTGILFDRLELRIFDAPIGVLIVDSSAKFLRVALEKFRDDTRVGLRLLRFDRAERRLQRLDEVLGPAMLARGVDAIASTNAVHLYPNLEETVAGWVGVLRPGGRLFVNSGNIRNPRARVSEWILDETVWVINDMAQGLVRTDPAYAAYRSAVEDEERMRAHAAFRDRVFLEPRPLDFYTKALERGGLGIENVREQTIQASVDDWYEFLTAYHDAVLGWVGGTEKVDGQAPTPEAVTDRLRLMRHAMEILFGGRPSFSACWTYLTARL
jgi:SAM-dependent methyltransferase